MRETLILTKVTAYELITSVDEKSYETKGYYKDYNIAKMDAKGAGWYNSNGEVTTIELFEDPSGEIYLVNKLGKYTDVDKEYKEKMKRKIKEKLTPEEIEFLKI
jgi:hypothetical protein